MLPSTPIPDRTLAAMRYITLALLLVACNAMAGDMATRVAAGNMAMATAEGQAYDRSLAPAIQSAMMVCAPPSQPVDRFVLVGDIDTAGGLSRVAVEPATPLSRCFAEKLSAQPLPVPPRAPRGTGAYPLTVEMDVTQ